MTDVIVTKTKACVIVEVTVTVDAIKLSALESYGGRPHTLSAYNTLTLKGIGDYKKSLLVLKN